MSKYGLEVNEDYIGLGYYVSESTRTYIPKLLEKGVTAILFSHDVRAISALTECAVRDLRVPEDLSIIGFDDLPMTAYTEPPLTTIRQDRISLGKCGYYALNCLLNNVPIGSILLRAPLIVRGSTGPVPPEKLPKNAGPKDSSLKDDNLMDNSFKVSHLKEASQDAVSKRNFGRRNPKSV